MSTLPTTSATVSATTPPSPDFTSQELVLYSPYKKYYLPKALASLPILLWNFIVHWYLVFDKAFAYKPEYPRAFQGFLGLYRGFTITLVAHWAYAIITYPIPSCLHLFISNLETTIVAPYTEELAKGNNFWGTLSFATVEFIIFGAGIERIPAFVMHLISYDRSYADRVKHHGFFNSLTVLYTPEPFYFYFISYFSLVFLFTKLLTDHFARPNSEGPHIVPVFKFTLHFLFGYLILAPLLELWIAFCEFIPTMIYVCCLRFRRHYFPSSPPSIIHTTVTVPESTSQNDPTAPIYSTTADNRDTTLVHRYKPDTLRYVISSSIINGDFTFSVPTSFLRTAFKTYLGGQISEAQIVQWSTFFISMCRTSSIDDKIWIVSRFCIDQNCNLVYDTIKKYGDTLRDSLKWPRSEGAFEVFDDYLLSAKDGVQSPAYQWMRQATTGLCMIPFFASQGITPIFKDFGLIDKKLQANFKDQPLPFFLDILRSVSGLLRSSYYVISGQKTPGQVFRESNPYATFSHEARFLINMQPFQTPGKTGNGMVNVSDYRLRLTLAIEQGNSLIRSSGAEFKEFRVTISHFLTSLCSIEAQLHSVDLSQSKPAAFIVLFIAPPGVGKSVVAEMSWKVLLSSIGIAFHRSLISQYEAGSKFEDGITNASQIIHYEEVNISPRDKMQRQDDGVLQSFLLYGDSNPKMVERSAVEQKGKHICRNSFVTGCTNSCDLNADVVTRFPAAVYRRILFVEIKVKDQFRKIGDDSQPTLVVDPRMIENMIPERRCDVYDYRFVEFDASSADGKMHTNLNTGKLRGRMEGPWLGINEYTQQLTSRSKTHFSRQTFRKEAIESLPEMCSHDCFKGFCPDCLGEAESSAEAPLPAAPRVVPLSGSSTAWLRILFASFMDMFGIAAILKGCHSALWFIVNVFFWASLTPFLIVTAILFQNDFIRTNVIMTVFDFVVHRSLRFFGERIYRRIKVSAFVARGYITVPEIESLMRPPTVPRSNLGYAFFGLVSVSIICYKFYESNIKPRAEGALLSRDWKDVPVGEVDSKLRGMGINSQRQKPDLKLGAPKKAIWFDSASAAIGTPSQNHPIGHTYAHIQKATRRAEIYFDDNTRYEVNCLAIMSDFILISSHCLLPPDKGVLPVRVRVFLGWSESMSDSLMVDLTKESYVQISPDVMLVLVPALSCRNIRTLMLQNAIPPAVAQLAFSGYRHEEQCERTEVQGKYVDAVMTTTSGVVFGPYFRYVAYHAEGSCGLPLVIEFGKATILLGIHCAGGPAKNLSYAAVFTRDQVDKGVSTLRLRNSTGLEPTCSQGPPLEFSVDGHKPIFGLPNSRSFLNWQAGNVGYEGTIQNYTYSTSRPKLTELPTAQLLERHTEFKNRFPSGDFFWGVPDTMSHPDGDEYYSPFHKFAGKAFQASEYVDSTLLLLAVDSYWHRLESSEIEWTARPLDIVSNLNGDNLCPQLRAINKKAAMGFGYKGKKLDFLTESPYEQAPDGVDFTPEIYGDYIEVIKRYSTGETVGPINKASLKEEPRIRTWTGAGFTTKPPRVFCATTITDVLVGRCFLLPLVCLLTKYRAVSECCVGINCASPEWGAIRARYKDCLEHVFGSDISGFDTRMPLQIKCAAVTILIRMARKCHYSDVELTILRAYLSDCLHPLVLVQNDLLRMPNLNVSGRVATAEFNSICLSIIYRMCFYMRQIEISKVARPLSFEKEVVLVIYGDDAKCGSKDLSFDQAAFIKCCRLFDIHATPADKGGRCVPFSPFDGVEFLHRVWRYDEEWGVYCAPLAFDSMSRSLTLNTPSSLGASVQASLTAMSVNNELAQHGRVTFTRVMLQLEALLDATGVQRPIFRSYDDIMLSCYGAKGGELDAPLQH